MSNGWAPLPLPRSECLVCLYVLMSSYHWSSPRVLTCHWQSRVSASHTRGSLSHTWNRGEIIWEKIWSSLWHKEIASHFSWCTNLLMLMWWKYFWHENILDKQAKYFCGKSLQLFFSSLQLSLLEVTCTMSNIFKVLFTVIRIEINPCLQHFSRKLGMKNVAIFEVNMQN